MKGITLLILVSAMAIFAAVIYAALQVKSAVDSTKVINVTQVMYESPVGQAFAPFAPVIIIVFGIVCFIVFMIKRL
jgi:hypothetical protein